MIQKRAIFDESSFIFDIVTFLFRLNLTREVVFFSSSFSFFVDNLETRAVFLNLFFFFLFLDKLVKLVSNFFYFYTFAFEIRIETFEALCIYISSFFES